MIINFTLLNFIQDLNKLPGFEVVNNILFKLFDKLFSLSICKKYFNKSLYYIHNYKTLDKLIA